MDYEKVVKRLCPYGETLGRHFEPLRVKLAVVIRVSPGLALVCGAAPRRRRRPAARRLLLCGGPAGISRGPPGSRRPRLRQAPRPESGGPERAGPGAMTGHRQSLRRLQTTTQR